MPDLTTNYSFNQPLVNNPVDQDLWGGQLNTNWGNLDTILAEIVPIGTVLPYAGTTAPNSRWLLCDGDAVSRTTYATLFALVGTNFGIGDGSTTFNLPDLRGRAPIGLDNLGGSSANRITDSNADSLNNTGGGSETATPSGTNGSVGSTSLSASQIPTISGTLASGAGTGVCVSAAGTGSSVSGGIFNSAGTQTSNTVLFNSTNTGGGSHNHSGSTFTGNSMNITQPWIALGSVIKGLL